MYHILFIHSSLEHVGCLCLLAVMCSVAVSICVQGFCVSIFISHVYVPGSGIAWLNGDSHVSLFEELPGYFSQRLNHIAVPPAMYEGFQFLHILTSTCYFSPFLFLFLLSFIYLTTAILVYLKWHSLDVAKNTNSLAAENWNWVRVVELFKLL